MFRVKSLFSGRGSCSDSSLSVLNFGTPGKFVLRSGGCSNSSPLANVGHVDFAAAGQLRPDRLRLLHEDRHELDFLLQRLQANGRELQVLADRRVADEGEHPVVELLLVVVDEQVVVALGALHVDAQEMPADVAHQARNIDRVLAVVLQPLRVPQGRAAGRLVVRIGAQHLADQLVPRLVRLDRLAEELLPLLVIAQPLHQHHVQHLRDPAHVVVAGQQPIDQRRRACRLQHPPERPAFPQPTESARPDRA